ncbi:zinc-binding metallopeptidase family protein [Rhizobium halophytocola]|uniref:Zinc-ribbon domain-containing protein n=1 Tax=Rhizobium halophytocola TaxID=735519 RepID=A0ABS4E0G8_9HYPH|nr:putative zinc-binding metallopeptidase [Rhizobium halophytocola]MBP1851436.1 hypothetical protein [Rhizobium halophytocola]
MKPFHCPNCTNLVHFDNETCLQCSFRLGYRPWANDMAAVGADGAVITQEPASPTAFFCDNVSHGVCNWMVEDNGEGTLCRACRHNVMIPNLSVDGNIEHWAAMERAKRYAFYSLLRWNLPLPLPSEEGRSLAFTFAADVEAPDGEVQKVMTGHDQGNITINLAEADDAERERMRLNMGEPYRTLVGHFRHELGHFFWDMLVDDGGKLDACRAIFGDERRDYGEALQEHYQNGAPAGWQNDYVSTYATSHPWEDFAETWAHYIHMTDGLETALSFGLRFDSRHLAAAGLEPAGANYDPYAAASATELVDRWVPVTIALNSINRSMGQHDIYPFVLSAAITQKLEFIHQLIHQRWNVTRTPSPVLAQNATQDNSTNMQSAGEQNFLSGV